MLYINTQTNTCVTVNRIRAALKVTAHYIPAATVCFILIIKQQNHSLLLTEGSGLKDCSFNKKQRRFNSYSKVCFILH